MTTKTLRSPANLAAAVHDFGLAEHIEESTAMRKLLRMGYDMYVAEEYRAGRLSLRDAANRMGTSLSEALDALQRLGIAGNVTADDTLQSLRSLAGIRLASAGPRMNQVREAGATYRANGTGAQRKRQRAR